MTSVESRTRAIALGAAVILPLATLLLYARGAALTPPGASFLWMHALNSGDTYAYLSWVAQARDGHLLFRVLFTEEPCRALLFHPLFLAIGTVCRITGLAPIAVFHATRVVLGGVLLVLLHRFFVRRLARPEAALFAFLYAALGSGLGWVFVRPDRPAFQLPVDLWMPEAIIFLTLLESPLFIAALILALLAYERLFPAEGAARRRDAPAWRADAALFGLALLLGFTHPFEIVSIAATLAAALLLGTLFRFATPPRLLRGAVAFLAGAAIPLAYVAFVMRGDPVFAHWLSVVRSPSPPPGSYLAAFGPQLLLALCALPIVLRRRSTADLLALAWPIGTALLLYAPLAQQRRFIAGVQIPLTLLAAQGLFDGIPAILRRGRPLLSEARGRARAAAASILRGVLIAGSFATNAVVIGADLAYFERGGYPQYLERDLLSGIAAYGARAPADALLLATPEIGHFVPALTGRRVMAGHYDMTIDPPRKAAVIRRVLDGRAPASERRALLDRAGVTHVLVTPYEAASARRDAGDGAGVAPPASFADDAAAMGLAPVFRSGSVALYEVLRPPAS